MNTCPILRVDMDRGEIFFTSGNRPFDFEPNEDLYCFWESEAMVFKVNISFISDFKMAVKIPAQVLTKEKRSKERIDCGEFEARVHYDLGDTFDKSFKKLPFSAQLYDYSSKGLGLNIQTRNIAKFIPGDKLTLRVPQLGSQLVSGKVVHIAQIERGEYKVGVSLA